MSKRFHNLIPALPSGAGFTEQLLQQQMDPPTATEMFSQVKGLVTDMGKGYEELKTELATIKTKDAVTEDKIKRITEDLAEKYAKAKDVNDAIDALKTKLAHMPSTGNIPTDSKTPDYVGIYMKQAGLRNPRLSADEVDALPRDEEGYKEHVSAFRSFMRKGDAQQGVLKPEHVKTLSVNSDPDGGFFVTPQISSRIITRVWETSPMRRLANTESISTDALEMAVDQDEVDAVWQGETQARPNTRTPVVGKKVIPVHELWAMPNATLKLLEDASVNIEAWLGKKVGDKIGRKEATAFITGNGVGMPRGILTYPSVAQPSNGNMPYGFIEQIGTGSSGLYTYSAFINMITSIKEPYQGGAEWLFRRQSIAPLLTLTDPANRYIFQPILNGNFNETPLFGYKINYASDMAAIGAGSMIAAFGDFRAAYTIVDRIGITTLRDPYTQPGFVVFKTRYRVGGDVVDYDAYKILVMS